MPSFLDQLQSSSDEGGPGAPPDVLAAVKAEGGRRRRRRQRRNLALGGLALAVVAVPALSLLGGSDGRDDVSTDLAGQDRDAAAESGAGATRATTSTTAPITEVAGVVITQVPEAPAVTATTARPRPTTTVPPLVCQSSVDPACGPFSWSPAPGANAPLSLSAPQGLSVVAGQSIDVVISWADADAALEWQYVDDFGTLIGSGCTQAPRYGPWTPPGPNPGSGTFTYTYTAPAGAGGTVATLGVSAASGTLGGDCDDPYRSEAQILVDVIVESPPAP